MRAEIGYVRALAVLGVMMVSASGAGGEQISKGRLYFACTSAAGIDPARMTAICSEIADVLKGQPDLTVITGSEAPIPAGPGLEILVKAASDVMLELVPTWVDASGNRTETASAGLNVADTTLTAKMRLSLYQRVLSASPF
jgi:hypothetical protein